jgi:asparagine synthase (glutamine-hydrolysing)
MPLALRRLVFGPLGALYPKMDWAPKFLRAKTTFQSLARDSLEAYMHTMSILHDNQRRMLYSERMKRDLQGYAAVEVFRHYARKAPTDHPLSLIQYLDLKTYLPGDILTKVDRTSMAVSLEVRVPMLDHQFVEWAATLPSALKYRRGEGKYLLKRALEPYVPKDNLYRRKQGFDTSLVHHFRGAGGTFVRNALLGEAMTGSGLFDMAAIAHLVDSHQSGMSDHSRTLWSLLMFDGFLREVHFPRARHSAAPSTATL